MLKPANLSLNAKAGKKILRLVAGFFVYGQVCFSGKTHLHEQRHLLLEIVIGFAHPCLLLNTWWCQWRTPVDCLCDATAGLLIFGSVVHLPGQRFALFFFFCACVCLPYCCSFVFLFKTNPPRGEAKTNMFVFPLVVPKLLFVRRCRFTLTFFFCLCCCFLGVFFS